MVGGWCRYKTLCVCVCVCVWVGGSVGRWVGVKQLALN